MHFWKPKLGGVGSGFGTNVPFEAKEARVLVAEQ